jgi:hypothetical protein
LPQQTITTSSAQVLTQNPYRRSIVFFNNSVNTIYVDSLRPEGLTTANASVLVPANSSRFVNWFDDGEKEVTQEWSAISNTGSNVLVFKDFSGVGIPTAQLNLLLASLLKQLVNVV